MPRPRCPRGHYLPTTGRCRCERPEPSPDLYGQRANPHQLRDMQTIPITGGHL